MITLKDLLERLVDQAVSRVQAADPPGARRLANHDTKLDLDIQVEQMLVETIRRHRPEDTIVGEETGTHQGSSTLTWYLDSVDGTTNLAWGRPDVAISVALFDQKAPYMGAVALPFRGLTLMAADGSEVSLNKRTLPRLASSNSLSDSLVGLPSSATKPYGFAVSAAAATIARRAHAVRITGSVAMEIAQVVIGELDARYTSQARLTDVAAAVTLALRAGMIVSDLCGREWTPVATGLVVSRNQTLHDELVSVLAVEDSIDNELGVCNDE